MIKIDQYLIKKDASIKDTMKKLDTSQSKILFVVEHGKRLFGAISDGDLRRWILSDGDLNVSVEKACNTSPIFFDEHYNIQEIKTIMLKKKIQCIPILRDGKEIVELVFWDSLFKESYERKKKELLSIPIVIMAGGTGTRLEPFTKILPKPLIPIGDKTILELIIEKFLDYGINEFYLSLGHKSRIIKSFLEELQPDYRLKFIEENKPLGTIGSLSMIAKEISEPVLVTNCDIIIETDYSDFLNFHNEHGYDITLVGSLMHYKIPYGICEIENGGKLKHLKEKPEYSHLVSTGMYILSKHAVNLIPHNEHYHVTQLIERLREEGRSVGVYPISENSWFDTGEWAEYHKVLKKMGFN